MRTFYLLFLMVLTFQACSESNDTISEKEDMQMDDHMDMEEKSEHSEETDMESAYSGNFVSVNHPTSGIVTVNEDKTQLIFKNFSTDDGPLLEVYLATNTNASNFISLGELKGIKGDYQYDLPENIDYTTYNHVIIWCVEFSVNFGYAVLE